eukprot:XP_011605693.1 PREDICTED: semaphorin-7A [Takifugu rubripes]
MGRRSLNATGANLSQLRSEKSWRQLSLCKLEMNRFFFISYFLSRHFFVVLSLSLDDAPCLGCEDNARILCKDMKNGCALENEVDYPNVFFYHEDSEEMYVGGTNYVSKLNVNDYNTIEKFSLNATGQQCSTGACSNVITVIEKFQDSLFVCGTNGNKPRCWKLYSSVNNQPPEVMESYEGIGISPFIPTQNSISLTVEGDLYSAAPLDADGSFLQFRRKAGGRTSVWMYENWVTDPTFISASWVQRKDDPDNEKIYVFFREKNADTNPEADPWVSRVARVCKVDEGGSKRFFQNMWTTFLKARLVCGFPDESLYFTRLQDIHVVHADEWHDTRVYALFTSSWNSTAVCVYSIDMIEDVFETSTFKGYSNDIPTPRPGTCVRNSKSLPLATINLVKNHPEMTDWVHPVHRTAPFYISNNNYIKIAVDRVQAAAGRMFYVLLLSTDSGKIHKVLEAGSKPFIISETQLSSRSPVQSIKLDSIKKKLVVGFSEKISAVDLQRCQDYNRSCQSCVLARDPYCSWTHSGCAPHVLGGIQDVLNGEISVCETGEVQQLNRTRREAISAALAGTGTTHSVPLGVPFYLSCPIDSYHAVYTWEHGGQRSPCLQMQSQCLHLIPAMTQENYGNYKCVSEEKGFTNELKSYLLEEQIKLNTEILTAKWNDASAVVSQFWLSLGLSVASGVMGMT